ATGPDDFLLADSLEPAAVRNPASPRAFAMSILPFRLGLSLMTPVVPSSTILLYHSGHQCQAFFLLIWGRDINLPIMPWWQISRGTQRVQRLIQAELAPAGIDNLGMNTTGGCAVLRRRFFNGHPLPQGKDGIILRQSCP